MPRRDRPKVHPHPALAPTTAQTPDAAWAPWLAIAALALAVRLLHHLLGDAATLGGGLLLIGGVSGFGDAWLNYVAVTTDIPGLIPRAKDAYMTAKLATGGAAFMVSYGTAVAFSCELQCSFGG